MRTVNGAAKELARTLVQLAIEACLMERVVFKDCTISSKHNGLHSSETGIRMFGDILSENGELKSFDMFIGVWKPDHYWVVNDDAGTARHGVFLLTLGGVVYVVTYSYKGRGDCPSNIPVVAVYDHPAAKSKHFLCRSIWGKSWMEKRQT